MTRLMFAALCLTAIATGPVVAADNAILSGGSKSIGVGDRATFPVQTRSDRSTEFSASCDLESAGSAIVLFDGRHYIPLSEPAVGDVISFNGAGTRRFDLTGTFEANSGDAEISFFFANVPVAFCFGGGDCASVEEASPSVSVTCGQN